MADNSTFLTPVSNKVLLFSVVFKFIAMIIGVLGNVTVIIYAIFTNKEKTATSYLVGNLALADLLVCLTFYPIWIIEFIQTILDINSDQDLFCKLSRSTTVALVFASVATLLAITVDRYLYIVKPLQYPLTVTKRRVFQVISTIWLTACCLLVIFLVYYTGYDFRLRSYCYINDYLLWFQHTVVGYLPLTLILILNIRILIVAEKQRKRILAETSVLATTSSNEQSENITSTIHRFFRAVKAVKTFSIVVAVLAFCVLTPTVVGTVLDSSFSASHSQMWFVVFHYEFYGINSIVNAFIYGMRHIKYRKSYWFILFNILRCNQRSD